MDSLSKTLLTAVARADVRAGLEALVVLDPVGALREIHDSAAELRVHLGAETLGELATASAMRASGSASDPIECLRLCLPVVDLLGCEAVFALLRGFRVDDPVAEVEEFVGRLQVRHIHHPAILDLVSRRAVERGLPEASSLLSRLGRLDQRQLTLDRIMRLRPRIGPDRDAPVAKIALLSSFTIDPLVAWLDLELRELGLSPHIRISPFNSWARELLDRNSDLMRFVPDVVFLAVSIDDLIPALSGDLTMDDLRALGRQAVDRVLSPIRSFRQNTAIPLVVHSFHSAFSDSLASCNSLTRWLSGLDAELLDGLRDFDNAYMLDMTQVLIRRSGGRAEQPKLRYLGALRLSSEVTALVSRAYAGCVASIMGLTRKCIVLDLDNTLWGGTVGEDGTDRIRLGDSSPGIEYKDFQRYLKRLAANGFLLAICSKNNAPDALEVIRHNPHMVLREQDFSSIQINWEPKPENLRRIAAELGIGLDSLVFVDDNPAERERVRQAFPEVLVPDLPRDPALYRELLAALPQLQRLAVTDEDRSRGAMYRAQRERRAARDDANSLDDYLRSLEVVVNAGLAKGGDVARIHQLVERTNQFNLTSRRYSVAEIADLARGETGRLYAARSADRFGDHGLVAVAVVKAHREEWTIESFLMSCRVIGYGVETALLALISEDAAQAEARILIGELVPSRKNAPARDFYLRHGFDQHGDVGGTIRFRRVLGESVARPHWVRIEFTHAG